MTKKVFRIHNEGALNHDWFSSTEINSNLIDSIPTDSGDGKKLPTSIPSPFARIDLVRTAFLKVADGDLEGLERNGKATATDNHKLVSDALDIGQILFNYDKHKNDLQLIAWDKKDSLTKLLNGNAKQKHLGKTLQLFLEQDRTQYNFNQFDKIYILKYKYKIIGGTSPRTLFFAAPNPEETQISFGQDMMLDDQLLPLYRRNKEYIKYLYSLSKTVNNFNENFPEFNSYLIQTISKLRSYDVQQHKELQDLDCNAYLTSLSDVVFNDNTGSPINVIGGVPLKQFVINPGDINSDFAIKTTKQITGYIPLVLPIEPLNLRYKYTEDQWDVNTEVPAEDNRSLETRTLPAQGDKYPYLTMNDFLTDSIVKLPYEIDSNNFITVGSKKYLLPIKEEFFKYFSVEDIANKGLIQTSDLAGGSVEVRLDIPIKNGNRITYKKIYFPRKTVGNQNKDPKKGVIIEKSFALSLYPRVKSSETPISYSVGIAELSIPNNNELLETKFYNSVSTQSIPFSHKAKRAISPIQTEQTIIEERFDIIQVTVGTVKNIIIPIWIDYTGNTGDSYEFTIDFGTTNSHIEYKIDGQGAEKAFDITKNDEQISFLMPTPNELQLRLDEIQDVLDLETHLTQEVLSRHFGDGEIRNAPFRTCLVQNADINFAQPTNILTHTNIGFDYEKRDIRGYLKIFTDLKWANVKENNVKRVEQYIEQMLVLCKNKVLMNNGNLKNTKITWFYPVSMTTYRLNSFRSIWSKMFEKTFGKGSDGLLCYPESIAPFYYYKANENINTHAKPSVSIDIGGGTSDVMIFSDGEPNLITSFKFAGNSIFGDGFNGNIRTNGFVQKFYERFQDQLSQNDLNVEKGILDKIYNENASSVDLVNFLFSLKNNKILNDKKIDLDFSRMLNDDNDLKIIFLLFYSSIVYHIAEMMKIKGMEAPRNILFSGTGSKTLSILDSDNKLGSLKKLFEAIFNEVYQDTTSKIKLKASVNPKQITCKGGFYIGANLNINNHNDLVEFNVGNLRDQKIQKRTQAHADALKNNNIDKTFREGVVENVENFYDLFLKLNKSLNFKDEFGVSVSSLRIFDEIKSDDLDNFVMAGLEVENQDSNEEESLSETLFFYPLIGKLNELATTINENKE